MTKDQAIKGLKETLCSLCDCVSQNMDNCDIKECDNRDYIKALEQQPSDDCVSRQAVIEYIEACGAELGYELDNESVREDILNMPPAIPTRKVGKWIYDKKSQNWRCSVCNETPKTLGYVGTADFMEKEFVFCNHCGAEMKGAENG